MTIRASEFDALAAKVDAGELAENEVVSWMAAVGWPGHSILECQDWWDAARRARPDSGEAGTGMPAAGAEGRPA